MWKCLKCKEELEDSFDSCWKCGTAREATPPSQPFPEPGNVASESSKISPGEARPTKTGKRSVKAPQESNRVCDWCATSISEQALKCPHCGKWRKEIAEERGRLIGNAVCTVIGIIGCVGLFSIVWNDSLNHSPMRFLDDHLAKSGVWHERVGTEFNASDFTRKMLTTPIDKLQPNNYMGNAHDEFSLGKFLSSFWGWAVIGSFICAVRCFVVAFRARTSLDRKWGSRWRL